MSKKNLLWLYQELPQLVAKGVLSSKAAENLRQYYGEAKSVSKKWFMLIVCGVTGTFLIGLGIILLFAHNWEDLSRSMRAFLSFLPLVAGQALAAWVLLKRPKSGAFKEASAVFLSLMVGASIALISQTYNIPGDATSFTLSWMLLIVPLVYLMQASTPALIYLAGITVWAGCFWDNPAKAVLFWPLAAVIMPHFIWACRRDTYKVRTMLLALGMIISVCIGSGFSLGITWPGSWTIIYSSIFAIFYFLGNGEFSGRPANWRGPFRFVGVLGIFILSFIFTYGDVWKSLTQEYYYFNRQITALGVIPDYIITFSIVAAAVYFFYTYLKRKDILKTLFAVMPVLAILAFSLSGQAAVFSSLIFNLYLLVLSLSHIIIGTRDNALGVVNMGMIMLAVLIIARFFDSDINFIIKGVAFILVGSSFLATNVAILRRRGGAR